MAVLLKYRGREVTGEDVIFIRKLVARDAEASRRALSIELCKAWGWTQPNGELRDGVCRGLLLELHRARHIELPASRWQEPRPQARVRRQPALITVNEDLVDGPLRSLGTVTIQQVRRTEQEQLVDALIARYHYLGAARPVGEHLKYLVTTQERPIACLCWSSAPRHLGPRDAFIAWSQAARKANIRFIAYQTRFLILPWVRVPHLASHLLGRMSRQLSRDWQQVYAHPIYFTETFVDPERNPGTCYRAANWIALGLTKGRGKDDQTNKPNRSLKLLFGYPLLRDFRRRLCLVQEA